MSIRSTCKAIVINENKILLNKCYDINNGTYYSLPGGGQETEEFMHEAIVREVKEETGYTVIPLKLVGIGEEICDDIVVREHWPEYIHKLYHIFLCKLDDVPRCEPTEVDDMQEESEWINIDKVKDIVLLPDMVKRNINTLITGETTMYLDSVRLAHHHG